MQVSDTVKPSFFRRSLRDEPSDRGLRLQAEAERAPFLPLNMNPRLFPSTGPNPNHQVAIWGLRGERLADNPCSILKIINAIFYIFFSYSLQKPVCVLHLEHVSVPTRLTAGVLWPRVASGYHVG